MRKIAFLIISILILSSSIISQTNINKNIFVGKSYWTKFVLATFSDCRIEITPDNISPNQGNCKFQIHLEANSKIKLKKIIYQKQWAKLIFDDKGNYEFEIFLKSDSKINLQKSFDLAFSKKSVSDDRITPSCNVKTRLDVIRKNGFPSEIYRKGKSETWIFDVGWIGGQFCGYDATHIEIKNGIVTDISGIV